MTQAYLEHANITVRDPERAAEMLTALFGWKERWRGPAKNKGFTIHVGSDSHYIAFYTSAGGIHEEVEFTPGTALNHLAFVVDDLDETERRVIGFGLQPFNHGDYAPGRRFYFLDENAIEYEIVSYAAPSAAGQKMS